MKNGRALIAVFLILTCLTMLSGCGGEERLAAAVLADEASIREAVLVADPQTAVDKIYESLEDYEALALTEYSLREEVSINTGDVLESYGMISDESAGLADVIILMPEENKREDVRLALGKYKEKRIAEFENYDILDSYSIAQNAVIYDQGDYIILLMLLDNESARAVIDEYIPL